MVDRVHEGVSVDSSADFMMMARKREPAPVQVQKQFKQVVAAV